MRITLISLLLLIVGCAQHYPRSIYADPDANPISCPTGSVVVVEKHGGGRMKSVGGERWHCQDADSFDVPEEDQDYEP